MVIEELIGGSNTNFEKLPMWFEATLRTLDALGEQKAGVHHPGHRGKAREHPLQQVLAQMLPSPITIETAFAINHFMTESKEQDLLVVDQNIGRGFCRKRTTFL